MNQQSGYYRFPTLHANRVVFVCEDDLWSVPASGGLAMRLTANLGEVSYPFLSPDGTQLAFIGREEGHSEVYVMPALGGMAQRLTFLGSEAVVLGWNREGDSILFRSNTAQPFYRLSQIYQISCQGGLPERLPFGAAHHLCYGPQGGVVLGRNTGDLARWKRYRGGRTGALWVDREGDGEFSPLIQLPGNLTDPLWLGDRIYFIADHDGIGNLYSCDPDGQDLKQHTWSRDYYIRNATTDGQRIVYQAGAELFGLDPASGENWAIAIEFHSPQVQRQRKFVDAAFYLEDYELHPEGHSLVVTSRGKSFWFGNWEGAVTQIGQPDGTRYRLTRWLNDKQRLVTLSDQGGEEAIEIHSLEGMQSPQRLDGWDLGRAITMEVSPVADQVVLSNHRHELIWVDLNTRQHRILDQSKYDRINGFCWSPDGKWVAYGLSQSHQVSVIKLCHLEDGSTHAVTSPRFWDFNPAFDPEGKYLYFLSYRDFNPVYDSHYFDLSFPRGVRPFLVSLQQATPSPFIPLPKPLTDPPKNNTAKDQATTNGSNGEEAEPQGPAPVQKKSSAAIAIDWSGIEHRVVGFPVPEGVYEQIWGLKGKVLFSSYPIRGSLDEGNGNDNPPVASLLLYEFDKQKQDTVASDVRSFKVARTSETLIYWAKKRRLRVCRIAPQNGKVEDEPGRKTGWLDLRRIWVSVSPPQEWQQMFREAWRLQKQHFWVENMSGVDWEQVYQRYRPLLDKITTRSEFSDLIWELQGELGTSHAYEFGGDYRRSPNYRLGFLGADFTYDAEQDGYRVTHIVQGDAWKAENTSALGRLGVNVQVGDVLLAIGGQRLSRYCSPQELLVHRSNSEVTLTFASLNGKGPRTVTVKALSDEMPARYREWVERNRQIVCDRSQGRVGYVHIPDMKPAGFAEFHRYYAVEAEREGLIVDVRYNRGGNVSQLLLEKLSRRRIGYKVSRWGQPRPYPGDAVAGPLVAITNELAASDGDIFSHAFKLMQLGTLVGKRTWGGVIGIWPRHALVDGSILTQPEFSPWFCDVGWRVENYGTDPDIEVEIKPQDWAAGRDPQLDRAIALTLEQLTENPVVLPEFGDRPQLTLPHPDFGF